GPPTAAGRGGRGPMRTDGRLNGCVPGNVRETDTVTGRGSYARVGPSPAVWDNRPAVRHPGGYARLGLLAAQRPFTVPVLTGRAARSSATAAGFGDVAQVPLAAHSVGRPPGPPGDFLIRQRAQ